MEKLKREDFPTESQYIGYLERKFDTEKYMGGFPREARPQAEWAFGPFEKYAGNPVFAPLAGNWDCGRFGGGVHNGSIIKREGRLYYVYRGEFPSDIVDAGDADPMLRYFGYKCDIGVAVSDDGINFTRCGGPFFRNGGDEKYSFEDVCLVKSGDVYYLFCNRWDWENLADAGSNGVFLATSRDLLHWEKRGLVFPGAAVQHRNAVILQDLDNEAVRINGKYVMYLNNGLIAYSDDMLHWSSEPVKRAWPGGEGCFALYDGDGIILFTGGNHSGHFYAVGEVLISKDDPSAAVDWLDRPVLTADPNIPYEACLSADEPRRAISDWNDTIFFCGMTRCNGYALVYYGGSEYYTCLAKVKLRREND